MNLFWYELLSAKCLTAPCVSWLTWYLRHRCRNLGSSSRSYEQQSCPFKVRFSTSPLTAPLPGCLVNHTIFTLKAHPFSSSLKSSFKTPQLANLKSSAQFSCLIFSWSLTVPPINVSSHNLQMVLRQKKLFSYTDEKSLFVTVIPS